MSSDRVSALVAAAGAGWETSALQRLGATGSGVVLLKRCVDLNDLLATAATGQADVALLADELPGLDADSVDLLGRCGVGVVLVRSQPGSGDTGRLQGLGIDRVLDADALSTLVETVVSAAAQPRAAREPEPTSSLALPDPTAAAGTGRLIAVWGPTGAPGRTTVAVGLAAELAHRGIDAFLVDADTYGGAVAQHLGVLDEMSGLLAAARTANAGQLDLNRLSTLARSVGPHLRVLTGLPRADRWAEVRARPFEQLLDLSRSMADYVVLDTGFCLEEDADLAFGSGAPTRNAMTLAALETADEVLVVGSADPVGLTRLARGLVELLEVVPGAGLRVVVNRARPSLGWGEKEIRAMIEGFATPSSLHFVPDDRPAADRSLVAGKSIVELGDSQLRRSVAELADAVTGRSGPGRSTSRRFGRGRRTAQAPNSR